MTIFKNLAASTSLVAAAIVAGSAHQAEAVTVDTVLSLVIDVSGSVNSTEYATQVQGYVNAFNDTDIQNAITDTSNGKAGAIAVNVIQFATTAAEAIGWTIIDDAADATSFAAALNGMARLNTIGGSTGIGNGITAAVNSVSGWLAVVDNVATRQVIDVSGDGANNTGTLPGTAGAAFCAGGGAINGVAILNDDPNLDTYYENNVKCGTGSFVLAASGFDTFGNAIKTKLKAEISGEPPIDEYIPLPAAAWFLLGGLGSLVALRRKKAA